MFVIGMELSNREVGLRIENDGSPCAESLGDIALHHRVGIDRPFNPVVILEAPDAREILRLLAVGLDRLRRLSLARP